MDEKPTASFYGVWLKQQGKNKKGTNNCCLK